MLFIPVSYSCKCYLLTPPYLAWGKVKLTHWTHKIDGLSESDFVFAAKVDQLPAR